ncbi:MULTISPECIES: DUF411 domain-containing protein [Rhodobacterales]|uniref:Uncharacterized conserved protein n=2 Tax=Rhodobacterales TaxID=204455 RepID=A0A1H3N152_9RHOB|nr:MULTISPECIES: DUF411 domain-containing protein [Rhodobacterales]PHP26547.1 metal-binding protein [Limimaricola cinnabarinus]SDY82538.1 Uncharacterized conserved protein [Citreimonas salinaria]
MNRKLLTGTALALAAVSAIGIATFTTAETDSAAVTLAETTVPADRQMTIWRDPNCGCCDAYADYMEENGYHVTRIDDRDFDKRSIEAGVPEQGLGCHLAQVDGYYVSGLVPAEIVARLTTERPEITGITLPGMPMNAPGMGGKSGTLKTYAFAGDEVTVFSDE